MKEYKIGEVFTTEDGKTVQCVRSNGLCAGCVFLTKIGDAPQCKTDIACCACRREDKQDVVFEELEELKQCTEYPVGKVLVFRGKVVEVVEVVDNNENSCEGCIYHNKINCNHILCIPCERTDDNYVKFKEHVTED